MIVGRDQGARVRLKWAADDHPKGRAHGVDGTNGDQHILQENLTSIQIEHPEVLLGQADQPRPQVRSRIGCALELHACSLGRNRDPARDLHRRHKLRHLRSLQPLRVHERQHGRLYHGAKGAEPLKKLARQLYRVRPGDSHPDEDGDQLGIGERLGAAKEEALPRPLLLGPRDNALGPASPFSPIRRKRHGGHLPTEGYIPRAYAAPRRIARRSRAS